MITHAKISPKMVNPRNIAGHAEDEEEKLIEMLAHNVQLLSFATQDRRTDYGEPDKHDRLLRSTCY